MELDAVDAVDLEIMERLRADGRAPFAAIAAEVGVPEAEVERRVAALRDAEILTVVGFLNTRRLGFDEVHYHLGVEAARAPELAERLRTSPHVRYAALVSGDRPLYLNCLFATAEERAAFENGPLAEAAGDAVRDQHTVEAVFAASYDYSLLRRA